MPKKDKKKTWLASNRHRTHDPALWKVGDPLTPEDEDLLSVLRRTYKQLGYTPSQKEVPNAKAIKKRFRLWSDAILAAGLPDYKDIEQIRRREEKRKWEEQTNRLFK